MKYFINEPIRCPHPRVTKKEKALISFLEGFSSMLLPDNLSLDAFIEEIRAKAAMLDKEYPRTLPFYIHVVGSEDDGDKIIFVTSKDYFGERLFDVDIYRVRGEFRFREPAPHTLLEGGQE